MFIEKERVILPPPEWPAAEEVTELRVEEQRESQKISMGSLQLGPEDTSLMREVEQTVSGHIEMPLELEVWVFGLK